MPDSNHDGGVLTIDLGAIAANYRLLRSQLETAECSAVVKANAYGHGLIEAARLYEKLGVEWLAVALPEEGIQLRNSGLTTPILVFGGVLRHQIQEMIDNHLDHTVSSLENLQWTEVAIRNTGKKARVHLKFDTGMERIGAPEHASAELVEAAVRSPGLELRGVYSHLACADDPDSPKTLEQLKRFEERLELFRIQGAKVPMRHLANSGGILHFPETHLDLVRPGIILYGVYPDPKSRRFLDLQPALTLKARVVYSKTVKAGSPISYGSTWAPEEDIQVVTLPLGYGDGFRRDFSNRGAVLIRGQRRSIVGRVCMDQFMVNMGRQEIPSGEDAVLIGNQGGETLEIENLAEELGTIPYELLTGLNQRIPRIYHELDPIPSTAQKVYPSPSP